MDSEFGVHSLSHTLGTRLGESGADAFTIMKLMGHSTATVSQHYLHRSPETAEARVDRRTTMNLHRAADKMNEFFRAEDAALRKEGTEKGTIGLLWAHPKISQGPLTR
jgi:site-specific recombinase XerD